MKFYCSKCYFSAFIMYFYRALIFSYFRFFLQSTNTHKHAYILTHVYYSNDFDLRKFRVTKYLPERNDYVSRGAVV
jgi:hypothetical protein